MKRSIVTFVVVSLVVSAAGAGEPSVNLLKLRPRATVYGDAVTLGDVLIFATVESELEDHLAGKSIFTESPAQQRLVLTHQQVVDRLDELGVNLARVLVEGSLRCEITLNPAAAVAATRAGDDPAPLLRGASGTDETGSHTLADMIQSYVDAELATLGGEAEVHFDRGGQEFLKLTTPPWDFRISSSGHASKLGLREFRVLIRRDGRLERTTRIYANVRLSRGVVVTRRPLSIGNFIRHDDVDFETRVFTADDDIGFAALNEVVGQQVKEYVPSGEMIVPGAIKSVDLVQRSRPVTVINDSAGIQVRLTGVALDSGCYGDTVRVRLGDTRRGRRMLRGVVTGLGTVRLEEGNL
jgi:flagella basal body P-ring formation protein FlgA